MSFLFGTGISSYQVEGAYKEDGKLPSIWDTFTHQAENIFDGSNGDIALDFYHRYHEDILLAKKLGIKAFRLSFSWCRVLKENQEENKKGIAFYKKVIDDVRNEGMIPVVTLFHWDIPQFIDDKGGFSNPKIVEYFANYVRTVAHHFASSVPLFLTFNEPQCFIGLGYQGREQAPKKNKSIIDKVKAVHYVLLAHAAAYKILKEANPNVEVGFVNTFTPLIPKDSKDEMLIRLIKEKTFKGPQDDNGFMNFGIFTDPLYLGEYPKDYLERYGKYLSSIVKDGDMEEIRAAKPQRVYINVYTGRYTKLDGETLKDDEPLVAPLSEQTNLDWLRIRPTSLYYGSKYCYERYRLPIVISENGDCVKDKLENGKVHDIERIEYLNAYLSQVGKAIKDGIPIQGYFYWSLVDNFEWSWGYSKRFGLVYIDYKNGLKRIPKDSFFAYQKAIKDWMY